MDLQVGVKAILRNADGDVLVLRRAEEKYAGLGGAWDIPGGRIDPGTSLAENLAREIREETGLTLSETPTLIAAQDILKGDRHVVRLTYVGAIEGDVTLSPEHTEYRWVSLQDFALLEGLDSYVRELLEDRLLGDA